MSFTIYKIYLKDNPELFYIGSTKNLTQRKYSHKSYIKNSHLSTSKLYETIRCNGGYDNIVFEKLQDYHYTFNKENHKKEQEYIEEIWIRHLQPTLNQRPITSWKEDIIYKRF